MCPIMPTKELKATSTLLAKQLFYQMCAHGHTHTLHRNTHAGTPVREDQGKGVVATGLKTLRAAFRPQTGTTMPAWVGSEGE